MQRTSPEMLCSDTKIPGENLISETAGSRQRTFDLTLVLGKTDGCKPGLDVILVPVRDVEVAIGRVHGS